MAEFVVDASAWPLLVLDQAHAEAFRAWRKAALLRHDRLLAPTLMPYEVGNVLLRELDRPGERDPALAAILFSVDLQQPDLSVAFAAADGLSFYDAAYLALAKTTRAALVTYDRRLAAGAKKANVKTLSPGAP